MRKNRATFLLVGLSALLASGPAACSTVSLWSGVNAAGGSLLFDFGVKR